jgi:DnaJ-class molecular chaperone
VLEKKMHIMNHRGIDMTENEELRTCPECLGSGEYGSKKDQFCRECNGEGYIE